MSELEAIKELLNDDLYAGSKDWVASNTINRIRWLIEMYEGKKEELDHAYSMLASFDGDK